MLTAIVLSSDGGTQCLKDEKTPAQKFGKAAKFFQSTGIVGRSASQELMFKDIKVQPLTEINRGGWAAGTTQNQFRRRRPL